MTTLGLSMIVKDEAATIARCLDSTLGLVDYYCICDTGSSDNTKELVRRWLDVHDRPGEVFDEPWRDFAHNRTVALWRLSSKQFVDYALVLDADDTLAREPGFNPEAFKSALDADVHHVMVRHGTLMHGRAQICRNDGRFSYRGVVHEFLQAPEGFTSAPAKGIVILAGTHGARSRDPEKYRKDALAIEAALKDETDEFMRRRYTFYLGNSWRDAGEPMKAIGAFMERSKLGGWDEEISLSLRRIAEAMIELKWPSTEIVGFFLAGWEACPRRAESLHGAARYCRESRNYYQGYLFAKQGSTIAKPADGLFIEPWIYQYGVHDELAVNAYWSGHYRESLEACEFLLRSGTHPDRARIERNIQFAREKLNVGA
jgi:hypothetical protein